MIRLFVKGIYMNPGGECEHDIKTFEIEASALEKYLTETVGYMGYGHREVIGYERGTPAPGKEEKDAGKD
jgi:hypothetical protein